MAAVSALGFNRLAFTVVKTAAAMFNKALVDHLSDKRIRLTVADIGKINILIILS